MLALRKLKAQQLTRVEGKPLHAYKPAELAGDWEEEDLEAPRLLKVDFVDDYDEDAIWANGASVISVGAQQLSEVCYLCGCDGEEEFVYCTVCSEPFHDFCIDEDERPTAATWQTWICPKCLYCEVCGQQENNAVELADLTPLEPTVSFSGVGHKDRGVAAPHLTALYPADPPSYASAGAGHAGSCPPGRATSRDDHQSALTPVTVEPVAGALLPVAVHLFMEEAAAATTSRNTEAGGRVATVTAEAGSGFTELRGAKIGKAEIVIEDEDLQWAHQLLQCHKCKNMYHAACLGKHYPRKPSKHQNIWAQQLTRVEGKPLHAYKPAELAGDWEEEDLEAPRLLKVDFVDDYDEDAIWANGASVISVGAQQLSEVCYLCGCDGEEELPSNYCPVCKQCYEDDDYDCEMVECSVCLRWLHATCEDMTSEMYHCLSHLPEDVLYNCNACTLQRPAAWQTALDAYLQNGLVSVITHLMNMKSAQHLLQVS
ncbi:PREDICTED: histone-lysine N-methyltransferase 2A-like [Priapulus caudatus]|uniref:Histone-lysine N-methyltransferase 2A-like n=1 Tax=Priapulus caudatus TaxID=37621 RepID=A0ABM1E7C6_PRICU|nr:PREDICTED: histone-lysine N-methyltransferase 2A-like [Priapulus caudatus]